MSPIIDHGSDAQTVRVRALDPLGADGPCRALRAWNDTADVAGMTRALRTLVPPLAEAAAYSVDEALAAMRDLGLFLGSVKRHGAEPLALVPEALPVLTELGRRTGMVPRDTVHHYCTWNPVGERRRMYTGDPQEGHLQDAVRSVFPGLRDGLEKAGALAETDPLDPKFAQLMDELATLLTCMVDSIAMVVDRVAPDWFAHVLRPYFEEITVGRRVLRGPAAAQVPLWLIDQAVWASDHAAPEYARFLRDTAPYSLPRWRVFYGHWSALPSAVSRLVACYGAYGGDAATAELRHPQLRYSSEALIRMLRVVVVFRGRHLSVARQAYDAEIRLYPVGSGGADVDLLRQILDLTRQTVRMTGTNGPPRRGCTRTRSRTCAAPALAAQSQAKAGDAHAPVPALNGKEAAAWTS